MSSAYEIMLRPWDLIKSARGVMEVLNRLGLMDDPWGRQHMIS